jgi:hypothetical protein
MHAKLTRDRKKLFTSRMQQTIQTLERHNQMMRSRLSAMISSSSNSNWSSHCQSSASGISADGSSFVLPFSMPLAMASAYSLPVGFDVTGRIPGFAYYPPPRTARSSTAARGLFLKGSQ